MPRPLFEKAPLYRKKVGKTTRPSRYALNQNPCNYAVEVTNRFKGLDLISLLDLHTWHRAQELAERFELLVYPRPECHVTLEYLEEKFPRLTAEKLFNSLLDGRFFEISSTNLRFSMEKSANWDNIISMTPEPAALYCRRHGLYHTNRSSI